ncbi:salicylate carboxymethyltransferase-like [Senna tora]|uniref:Salicylate carboxymethyltransferase-like n=1 Tax=Senna tora TaxID=362788 RepID=A0A834SXG2_9FABA|nr:salicylate carboxymethyltransferase-like [Senna tora]
MEVAQVLHMNGGVGESSYANNSLLQEKVLRLTKWVREEAISNLYRDVPRGSLAIADLGCSSGPNTFFVVSEVIKHVERLCLELKIESPQYTIFLNDLPGNDFNNIFKSLGSFKHKFQRDFSMFLKCRAEEVVEGGCMVLTFLGRENEDPSSKDGCYIWELMATALNHMVSEGIIKEEEVDSFNIPQYTPSASEVEREITKEGSFSINRINVCAVNWDASDEWNPMESEYSESEIVSSDGGYNVAKCMRAVAEPLLLSHFGEDIIEEVFSRYQQILTDRMSKEKTQFFNVTLSLTRRA